jgi:hypothetical protein
MKHSLYKASTVSNCFGFDLVPPSLFAGTEVFLDPRREEDLSILSNITVGKSKGKRSRSSDNGTIGGILRSMTWALELVCGSRPRDDASQVSAHSVKTERFKSLVRLDDKVTAKIKNNCENWNKCLHVSPSPHIE